MSARLRLGGALAISLFALSAPAAVVNILRAGGPACDGALTVSGVDRQRQLTRTWTLAEGVKRLDLDRAGEWHVALIGPARCWAPALAVPAATEALEWRVVPAGELSGRIVTEREEVPSFLSVRFQVPPRERVETLAMVACPVGRDGTFSCRLPAGELDLRLEAVGYAPVYIWNIRVADDAPSDVGMLRLSRGASVAGWITAGRRPLDLTTVDVTLEPLGAAEATDAEANPAAVLQTRPNRRGFFQFQNVPAGTYVLTASGERVAAAPTTNVRVAGGEEVVLDPAIELVPFARAEVHVTPPLDPQGQPWRVTLQRRLPASTYLSEPVRGTMTDGRWTAQDLRPGAYVLRITDGSKSVEERREIDIVPDMPPLFVAMAVVPVKGVVRAGTRGLEATLECSTVLGAKAGLKTDEQGRFEGYLPAEGKWNIQIRLVRGKQTIRMRSVEVRRRDGEPHARLDLDLPEGIIRGKVTDEQGNPSAASLWVIYRGLPRTSASVDASGEFELIGLDEGAAMIEARRDRKESGLISVDVSESTPPVTLVLRKPVVIEGWVTTPAGHPVAGAVVRLFSPRISYVRETVTSPSGRFTVHVPADVNMVSAAVVPAGLPAVVTTIFPAEANRVDIVVPQAAARLLLRGLGKVRPWLAHEQAVVSIGLLLQPSYGGVSPNLTEDGIELYLAPGQYLLCPTFALTDGCRPYALAAGTRVVVDLTDSPTGGER